MVDERTAWQRLRDGETALAEAEARLAPQEEWELLELLEQLRGAPLHVGPTHVWFDAKSGSALLTLLETEYCKRRIGAAGWCWGARGPLADGVHLHHPVTHGHGLFERDEYGDGYWTSAAEYAEAHAQEVPE